ncbi:pigment-dispersing factor receptor isoform X2 [Rhodnius prolixus]|uniref:pigment-dispersing factor receptor isoform X2 n=1 Tax=Rhodnius prolixus TaxID=13249 RepID=UPI003D18A0CD
MCDNNLQLQNQTDKMGTTVRLDLSNREFCKTKHDNVTFEDTPFCPAVWDQVLCWPPTKGGLTSTQSCPNHHGVDPSRLVSKRCLENGKWEGIGETGWTNYTTCYSPDLIQLFKKLFTGPYSHDAIKMKYQIAERTRTLEIYGFSISLAALFISLYIFSHFRVLKNNRTKIHKNLFAAMVAQAVIRLTLYVDQAIIRARKVQGIDNTPILCEASYVLLEYARTAMFMWMFIEGLYLHNVVSVRVFQETFHYKLYTSLGWGAPVIMTSAWAVTLAVQMKTECWWGYNLSIYFWILEGPRFAVVILNFLFLLNIIRVLVVKLRQSHTNEIEQVRKAVRAAVVLLPLLGITNLANMLGAPLDRQVWEFAAWSYATHFLTSFQGFFVAALYCFLNGEVRNALRKSIYTYLSRRSRQFTPRRNSAYASVGCSRPEQHPETRV